MPNAVASSALDPFFTTKTADGGTGLGLAIVHGTVKAVGGAVRIDTQPDHGTIVTLYLPAQDPGSGGDLTTRQIV